MKKRKPARKAPAKRKSPETQAIVRVAAPVEKPWELDNEQVTILKNAVAKGATDEELRYCLTVARRYRLDPFKRQIWFVSRWDKSADNGKGGTGAFVWTPQVGIDGLLFMSARDHHSDFGSVSLPEYGPMYKPEGANFMAPEWAKVKVFKKGVAEPTEAIAYFDEYCPSDFSKAPFWRKMPRRMIGKCASALALRQAYPDLGGLYIPEECERIGEDYTPGGRQIVQAGDQRPSQEVNDSINILKAKGLWCDEHNCVRNAKHMEVCEASRKALKPPVIDVPSQPQSQPGPIQEAPKPAKKQPPKPIETKYELTIDWSLDRNAPVLTGHLEELGLALSKAESPIKMIWGKDELWHAAAKDVPAIMQIASKNAFLVKEIQPNQVPPGGQQRSAPPPARKPAATEGAVSTPAAPAAGPSIVSGTIERVQLDVKYSIVTLVTKDGKKPAWKCWSKTVSDILLKNLGKLAEVILESRVSKGVTYTNVVGLKSCAGVEYDEDGKTPIIQNNNREAGGKTLF